jgi:hypothetical protein
MINNGIGLITAVWTTMQDGKARPMMIIMNEIGSDNPSSFPGRFSSRRGSGMSVDNLSPFLLMVVHCMFS